MELGLIGLGKMGGNMARRLARAGHRIVAFDISLGLSQSLAAEEKNVVPTWSLDEMAQKLAPPRAVWFMVPAGDSTEQVIDKLLVLLSAGDTLIDGGNSHYRDTVRRSIKVAEMGMDFVDAGTSGGVWGLREGYCLMVGGDERVVERLRPILQDLAPAPDAGWGHVGRSGSGHFVKMVHNGIEYGLMQAYAEGFDLMKHKAEFDLDLHQISQMWRHGSVVRSWLLDLIEKALAENPKLEGIAAYVPDSGEGRWTAIEAIELGCATPVISAALQRRFRSRDDAPFSDKLLAALRNKFGGHDIKPEE
jgi:6-phosphogluconate dehydrogenase